MTPDEQIEKLRVEIARWQAMAHCQMAGTAAANKGIRRLQRQLAARDGRIAELCHNIAWAIGYLKRFQLMARTIGDEATTNGVGIVVENLERLRVQ